MILATKDQKPLLDRIAFNLFLLFLFFLPLYEAPKNIFSVFFVFVVTLIACTRNFENQYRGKKNLVVWALLLLAVSAIFSGVNSPYLELGKRIANSLNWALMPLVALGVLIADFSKKQLVNALRIFLLGTLVAVAQSFSSWTAAFPELNSVGHPNQSALYLAFSLIPAMLLFSNRENLKDLILVSAVTVAVMVYQLPVRSLVGFGAAIFALVAFTIIYCAGKKYLKGLYATFFSIGALMAVAELSPLSWLGPFQGIKQEFDNRLSDAGNPYSQRDRLLLAAFEITGYSVTGYGLGSFSRASDLKNVRKAVESRGGDWNSEYQNYFSSNHGHNIFANVLVERGWLGILVFTIFLTTMLKVFIFEAKGISGRIGGLTVAMVCLAGAGQTTLHLEHGQLAFVCLVLCFGMEEKS